MSARYPENQYRDQPDQVNDLHDVDDVHDVTLGPDGGGAHAAATSSSPSSSRKKWMGKPLLYGTVICLVVVAVLVTIIAVVGGKKDGERSVQVGVALPPPEIPQTELEQNRNALAQVLSVLYSERGMDMTSVSNPESFQGRALDYVAGSELYNDLSDEENVERYALVVFYLYTYRQPHLLNAVADTWLRNGNWLTKSDTCSWEGIACTAGGKVQEIDLQENRMSGVLPMELSLLEELITMDFSSNLLYMDEDSHALWSILPNLEELIMDDNYFISETGIPVQFAGLLSIEKISLSFNLLQGTFDEDVFGSMTTLIHFEAESNYISGSLPANFLTLPNLTYVYIRRNSFEFPLSDVFASGNLPSLFALWLDGNTISGQIPTAIGEFTAIASLSITESDLTGPIPVEMGNLVDLQRLWLYENKLNGAIPASIANSWTDLEVFEVHGNELIGVMPQAICAAVTSSTYELATLSADCQEIQCDCCTDCY